MAYKVTPLTGRNKGGCLKMGFAYKWCISIEHEIGYNHLIFGWVEDFYRARKWCEDTWGDSTEYDLWSNSNFTDHNPPIPFNQRWTWDFNLDKSRMKIFLKTDAELAEFSKQFTVQK